MTFYTVIGADGFIGSNLVRHLRDNGEECISVGRYDAMPQQLGHAIYCAGVTSDFRKRPQDTITAHVCLVNDLLYRASYDSFTYLSSTRVYENSKTAQIDEDANLMVQPASPGGIFNLSKLAGEAACLATGNPKVFCARISNVYGANDRSDNFLTSLLKDAFGKGKVVIRSLPESQKDFVALADVLEALRRIPHRAHSRILNIASGVAVSNADIAQMIRSHVGCPVEFDGGDLIWFPRVVVGRMTSELGIQPSQLSDLMPALVQGVRTALADAP